MILIEKICINKLKFQLISKHGLYFRLQNQFEYIIMMKIILNVYILDYIVNSSILY